MESHTLTGLFPPIAYSFDGKAGPSPPKLAEHRSRGRLQPGARRPWALFHFHETRGWPAQAAQAGCLRCHLEAAALVAPHLPLRGKPRGVADDDVVSAPESLTG